MPFILIKGINVNPNMIAVKITLVKGWPSIIGRSHFKAIFVWYKWAILIDFLIWVRTARHNLLRHKYLTYIWPKAATRQLTVKWWRRRRRRSFLDKDRKSKQRCVVHFYVVACLIRCNRDRVVLPPFGLFSQNFFLKLRVKKMRATLLRGHSFTF